MTRRTKTIKFPSKHAINKMFRSIRITKIWTISVVIAVMAAMLLSGIFMWASHRHDGMPKFHAAQWNFYVGITSS